VLWIAGANSHYVLPEDRPLVYVSLGSSGQQGLLGEILRALAPLPVTDVAAAMRAWAAGSR